MDYTTDYSILTAFYTVYTILALCNIKLSSTHLPPDWSSRLGHIFFCFQASELCSCLQFHQNKSTFCWVLQHFMSSFSTVPCAHAPANKDETQVVEINLSVLNSL